MDRSELLAERAGPVLVGRVARTGQESTPYLVLDGAGEPMAPIAAWITDLMVGDASPNTCRAYCYALLTWFRVLWSIDTSWQRATEGDVAAMVGWMRAAKNPQRRRRRSDTPLAGSVNPKTGKRHLPDRYGAATINLTLAAVRGFYEFHARFGVGPVLNPVPESRREAMLNRHRAPDTPRSSSRRARLRQKSSRPAPRAMPDQAWEELFATLGCDRDRALLACYVSSGARASELLGVRLVDIDWPGQRLWVVSKGSQARRLVPLSPEAVLWLARYIAGRGGCDLDEMVWRTLRGPDRPLTYSALRRVLQRANDRLGTNWTVHDLRHTAGVRMANDPALTLTDVQTILGHADISTTTIYTVPRVEEMFDRLHAYYTRPRSAPTLPAGYDPLDMETIFGAARNYSLDGPDDAPGAASS
ncbi:tyrosine-type recombinase/integrase [Streptomyces rubrogriseus]|uniref:tyrosine-type recombinase/integrase n=1 Tax=Streptomyces rubrogriseus TaxID=194673 RepID=UPI0037CF6048